MEYKRINNFYSPWNQLRNISKYCYSSLYYLACNIESALHALLLRHYYVIIGVDVKLSSVDF